MTVTKPRRSGFTLVELLVVIAIIVTLMAILVPVVNNVQKKAVALRAKTAAGALSSSIDAYYAAYNRLPANSKSAPAEDTEVESTEEIMSVLAGFNIDDMNKKETVFFSGEEASGSSRANAVGGLYQDANGAELFDPWKKKPGKIRGYVMLLDYDYSQKLDNPFDQGNVISRKAVVWATGKDGEWRRGNAKAGVNEDNVYSWF